MGDHRFLRFLAVLLTVVIQVTLTPRPALASTYFQVDDWCSTSSGNAYFYPDGPIQYWNVHNNDGSGEGCHMWTSTVCGSCSLVNWANWYLPVKSSYDNTYDVYVWRVCKSTDPHWSNTAIRYQRWAYGTSGGNTQTYTVSQNVSACNQSGKIMSSAYFQASSGGKIRMIDKSSDHPNPANADFLYWYAP